MTNERLEEIKLVKVQIQTALADKQFKNLNSGEKDMLIECMAKMLGLIS